MPSILAFFNDNKNAHDCLLEVRKNLPHDSRAYTVAQHEYQPPEHQVKNMSREHKSKISTKAGVVLGGIIGILFAVIVEINLFASIGTFAAMILIIISSAAAGGLIGLFVLSALDKVSSKDLSFKEERGELILIVENPLDSKEQIVQIIDKYSPEKLKVY